MRRIIAVIPLLSLALAQSTLYGTQVDGAWFDRIAALYQTPKIESVIAQEAFYGLATGASDFTRAVYPVQHKPLSYTAFVGPAPSGGVNGVLITTNPTPDEVKAGRLLAVPNSACALLGEAAMGERIIRNAVDNLENAVGNEGLKQLVLGVAAQNMVYLEYSDVTFSKPETPRRAVAVAGNLRVPADAVRDLGLTLSVRGGTTEYTAFYRAEFSILRLQAAGAVQGNRVTFQHGWAKSDFCAFDLSKLP